MNAPSRPEVMFIGADSQLKSSLQLLFSKLGVKANYTEPLQAIGQLMQRRQATLIIWRCAARTRENQKILMQLSDLQKKQACNILVLCPSPMFAEMKSFGMKNLLPIPFKGMAFYQKLQQGLQTSLEGQKGPASKYFEDLIPPLIPPHYAHLLAAQEFFNEISNDTFVMLVHYGKFAEFPPLALILKENQVSNDFYLIIQGMVQVELPERPGQALHSLTPGSCFGEMSLLGSQGRPLRLVAQERTRVFTFPADALEKLEEPMQLEIYKELTRTLALKINHFLKTWNPA